MGPQRRPVYSEMRLMRCVYIPDIAEQDYAAFRDILDDHMPVSFREWASLKDRLHRSSVARGDDVVFVQVDPSQFARFLGASGYGPEASSLIKFARDIATKRAA